MRASIKLFSDACRITLFTRKGCGLCDTAKDVLLGVQARKQFIFNQVDIDSEGQGKWKVYDFDVPVIHVEKEGSSGEVPASSKLMHRFSQDQVEGLLVKVERQ